MQLNIPSHALLIRVSMLSNFNVVLSFFEKYNHARLLGSNLCHNLSLKILPRQQKIDEWKVEMHKRT